MGTRLRCALLLLGLSACSAPTTPVDGSSSADGANSVSCRSDRECSALMQVCDRTRGVCVGCLSSTDCTQGQACVRSNCVPIINCTSSRMCPGQVCDRTLGYCVDCISDADCQSTERCQEHTCIPRPRPCMSSRQCSDLGLVCDPMMQVCVECVGEVDCNSGQLCRAGRCLSRICTPGQMECLSPTVARVCEADGTSYRMNACSDGQRCVAGTCTTETDAAVIDVPSMDATIDVPDVSVPLDANIIDTIVTDTPTPETGIDASLSCTAGQTRCDPNNSSQVQRCGADGVWSNGEVCSLAMGLACNNGRCEDRCTARQTYLGCEFWPTQFANSQLNSVFPFAVVTANPQTYTVSVEVSGGSLTSPIRRTLMPGAVEVINLPRVNELLPPCAGSNCTPASSVLRRGGAFRLRTDGPIAAYQFNPLEYRSGSSFSYSADASLLLPSNAMTGNYIIASRPNWAARDGMGTPTSTVLGGSIAIVPVLGPTEAVINVLQTASVSAGAGVAASTAGLRTYRASQGDVLQLVGRVANEDLTGTFLQSNVPLAVFSGHDCTNIPADRPACDHLEEQLLPAEMWGRNYLVSQLRDRSASEESVVRIIAQTDDLRLTFNGITTPTACSLPLRAGTSCEFLTAGNFEVVGTQPFLAVQFMLGQGALQPQCMGTNPPSVPECMGDPAMVLEVPQAQFRSSYDFFVPSTYVRNFVNIVAPTSARILLDGVALTSAPTPIGTTAYQVYFVPLSSGRHRIESSDAARFGIKIYGVAPYTSYMYPGGTDLRPITPPPPLPPASDAGVDAMTDARETGTCPSVCFAHSECDIPACGTATGTVRCCSMPGSGGTCYLSMGTSCPNMDAGIGTDVPPSG